MLSAGWRNANCSGDDRNGVWARIIVAISSRPRSCLVAGIRRVAWPIDNVGNIHCSAHGAVRKRVVDSIALVTTSRRRAIILSYLSGSSSLMTRRGARGVMGAVRPRGSVFAGGINRAGKNEHCASGPLKEAVARQRRAGNVAISVSGKSAASYFKAHTPANT